MAAWVVGGEGTLAMVWEVACGTWWLWWTAICGPSGLPCLLAQTLLLWRGRSGVEGVASVASCDTGSRLAACGAVARADVQEPAFS